MTNWHIRFLELTTLVAGWSKDPSTKVGAVIVGPDNAIRSTGFNGLPRGIEDTDERLNNRDTKYKLIVHAEMNAILNAARMGVAVKNCTMFMVAFGAMDGKLWGGPPCTRCTVELIQAGIAHVVVPVVKDIPERWRDDVLTAKNLLVEAGVLYTEVEL